MIDIKLSLTIELQGSSMFSSQSCEENGKPLLEKHDLNTVSFKDKNDKRCVINFLTRKCIPARKSINICREAYEYFVSAEEPANFKGFRQGQHWKNMSKTERLEWHLNNIAENFEGKVIDYHVFED